MLIALMPPTHGLIDRKAPVERIQLDATSWVDVVRAFAHDTERTFERLVRDVPWRQNRQIRGGRMVDDPRLDGALGRDQSEADPTFHFARLVLDARYRVRMSGPGLVYYRNGRDSMGFHRDDEMRWLDRTVVAGLAFGATRSFQLVKRSGGSITEIVMASGDLYVMGGRCQVDWYHGVPKVAECGPKISAVWRWTAKIGRPVPPYRR
jgi:alkylated DNA repair dioxygenase AlkB